MARVKRGVIARARHKKILKQANYSRNIFYILLFFAIILSGYILKATSSIILPIIISIFLSLVFFPIVKKLNQKFKFPWVISSILITTLFLVAIFAISTLLVTSLSSIATQYPKYEDKFMSIYKIFADSFNWEFDAGKSFFDNMWSHLKVREYVQKAALFFSSGVFSFGKSFLMIILLLVFLLIEMRLSTAKINVAFANKKQEQVKTIMKKIVSEVIRFISIKFFISLATGLIVFLGTSLIGLDFPIVWGFLAFVMNFIPTFGSIFSSIITTLFSLLQFYPEWWKVIFVFILMLSVNMILGNIVEPRIEGKQMDISPVIILIGLTIWGGIWGFIGMILAVPMLVIIKIICENISFLHTFAILIGNDPETTKSELNSLDETD